MTTINPSPSRDTATTVDATYVDPCGVIYVLELNPTSSGRDDEARVSQHRDGRTRVVATGSVAVLRSMLTTWAEVEGGNLR